MIILYELSQLRTSHAPFTLAFAQVMLEAFPGRRIAIYAHSSHLQEVFNTDSPVPRERLIQHPVGKATPTTLGAFSVLQLLCRSYFRYRTANDGVVPFVVFLTGEPKHIWVAKLFRRFVPGFRCHLVLHGDINQIQHPFPRNPFRYLASYQGSMAHANHRDIRYLVLEPHIQANVVRCIPGIDAYVDTIHHPCSTMQADWQIVDTPTPPVRFAILGIAGRSKGLDVFARLAKHVKESAGEAADFRLVGKLQSGWQALDLSGISGPLPLTEDWLPRSVFEAELRQLHFAILPYNANYYAYAASGVLLDALKWRKPIISFRVPPVLELAERFGDIGYICDDEQHMRETVGVLVSAFDPDRYQRQRRNLDAAYVSRLPIAIAAEFRNHVRQ